VYFHRRKRDQNISALICFCETEAHNFTGYRRGQ
jgi:hypothetical protein